MNCIDRSAGLLLFLLAVLAGCGQKPTEPFEAPQPPLATGTAHVQWRWVSADCDPCVTTVWLDHRQQLRVVVVEGGRFTISAAETKQVEWEQAWELVAPIVHEERHIGCRDDLPEESFSTFAGDAGFSTRVEGCEAPPIEGAREHLRSLVQRYLPKTGL